MSYSLQIAHGDLSLGGRGMNTVAGSGKLVQDLACAILEPMGTDDMHPTYGSVIDGGTLPNGIYQEGVIGQPNDAMAASFVNSEVRRVATEYQTQQLNRHRDDVATYGKSTLTADEALLAVEGIDAQAIQDHLLVTATLQTGSGHVALILPTSTNN